MFTARPLIQGTFGIVAAGHYLAAQAGMRLLEAGGNAFDAAAAAGFASAVLEPHLNGLGGEVPILAYVAREGRVVAYSGQGPSPAGLTSALLRTLELERIPGRGLLAATVPAVVDAWTVTLSRYGRKTLAEVLAPAIEMAERGFPVDAALAKYLADQAPFFHQIWPTTAAVFTPDGHAPKEGQILIQPSLANTLRLLASAERESRDLGREIAIQHARHAFYRGPVAEPIARFVDAANLEAERIRSDGPVPDRFAGRLTLAGPGYLTREDLSTYHGRGENPVSIPFRGLTVCKCGPWTQGPVFLQQLRLLDTPEFDRMTPGSAEYLHFLIEAGKLAFADREAFYGDPRVARVPISTLCSPEYADGRRKRIDPIRAARDLAPGMPDGHLGHCPWWPPKEEVDFTGDSDPTLGARGEPSRARARGANHLGDTTHFDIVDAEGNMVSATQSGGWIHGSPIIPGLGFALGTRAQMFCIDEHHPNGVGPRKRPRTTLSPTLILRDGRPILAFGTPGGDGQDQWTLQFFLNHVVHGMGLQEAIEAPTIHSLHFPSSFSPHEAYPARVAVESRIPPEVRADLEARGHEIQIDGEWSHGRVCAVARDPESGVLSGAASPRRGTAYVIGR